MTNTERGLPRHAKAMGGWLSDGYMATHPHSAPIWRLADERLATAT